LTFYAIFLWWRGKLFDNKCLLRIFAFSVLLPQIANQAGWFAAEMGRQPWIVYGHLRTSEGFSQEVSSNQILFSLILFFIVYALLFLLFMYSVNKKIKQGPFDETKNELEIS
ncbi:MAG: cytochrome ubiquinol oxidase subunit I, partial [Flavobacteriaceae bacterium CG_4_8_14_3_um_filter_31_8]